MLEQPSSTREDMQIGQYAFPKLTGETRSARSARIAAVSAGTHPTGGYLRSLQSALDSGA